MQTIRFAIGTSTASSSTSIPAGSVVLDALLDVTTPYSAGATISIGQTGSASLLQSTSNNVPQSSGLYDNLQDTTWGGTLLPVLATVSGSPSVGSAIVVVNYVPVPNT